MHTMSFSDFETAGQAVLAVLHKRLGFDLWMVTRKEGDDWIVLQTDDHGYGVEPGQVFKWADTFCSQMVKGNGPSIAPSSDLVPAYAMAPIGSQVPIKAYVGLPIVKADGSLFGTLCGIHPSSRPEEILEEQELVELVGAMLSSILQFELKAEEETRRAEKLEAESLSDSLTQLYNRRGWDGLLAAEEDRCRRYGHPAAILVIDLDDLKIANDTQGHAAGDQLLVGAATALREAARSSDIVARLGGDEFGILSVECQSDNASTEAMLKRVRAVLADAGVTASVGLALRDPATGLKGAWELADQRMYAEKHSR